MPENTNQERLSPLAGAALSPALVIGLGNPILGDDGVGWRVAEVIQQRLLAVNVSRPSLPVEVDCLSLGGLSLMERLVGYDQVVIIDAVNTSAQPLGTVTVWNLQDLPNYAAGHTTAAHDTSLQNALLVGQSMGASLPQEILVVGVESNLVYDFTEQLSAAVEAAVPIAEAQVQRILKRWAELKSLAPPF